MKTLVKISVLAILLLLIGTSAKRRPTTLFMAGDSTMADKEELVESPERGWGQLFPTYIKEKLHIENHARNGRSTRSFITEGRWDDLISRVQKGDIVLIQFGHNDEKSEDSRRYADTTVYRYNLIRMVHDVREKGATPILATPIARREFNEQGELTDRHGAYPDVVRQLAKDLSVDMIDLHKTSTELIKELGPERSKELFMNVPAGVYSKFPDGKIDNTHLTEKGALVIGEMAADAIKNQKIKPLKKYLRKEGDRVTTYTTPADIKK